MSRYLRDCNASLTHTHNHDKKATILGNELVVIDFGSGTTKLKKLKFDPQTKKWNIITQNTLPVPHQRCLEESESGKELSQDCIASSLNKVSMGLKTISADCGEINCLGIATAWARHTSNLADYFEPMEHSLGIKVRVLSQIEEAELGYIAAMSYLISNDLCIDEEKTLIYDIGGASFQLTLRSKQQGDSERDEDQKIHDSLSDLAIYQGPFGSVNFAHRLREHLNIPHSEPRLLTPGELSIAKNFTEEVIGKSLASSPIAQITKHGQYEVYAVGDFMNKGLMQFVPFAQAINKDTLVLLENIWLHAGDKFKAFLPTLSSEEYIIEIQTNMLIVNEIMNKLGILEIRFLPEVSIAGAVNYLPDLFLDANQVS